MGKIREGMEPSINGFVLVTTAMPCRPLLLSIVSLQACKDDYITLQR